MKPALLLLCAAVALSACGGGGDRGRGVPQVGFASGPIADGCLSSGRRGADRALCGCVQFVANQSLSSADQRLARTFYDDPQRAQDMRQSDNPRHEAFWDRYIVYAEQAERLCAAYA